MSERAPTTPREWLNTIHAGHRLEEDWRAEVGKIVDLYSSRGNRIAGSSYGLTNANVDSERCDFNVLFANTQVLFAAVYSNAPRPDVRRRFRDKDPIARQVSEVIERCLSYSIDNMDWEGMMRYVRLDYLLGGRAITRVKYEPKFKPGEKMAKGEKVDPELEADESGPQTSLMAEEEKAESKSEREDAPEPELVYQTVSAEAWPYKDFARSPHDRWDQTEWIAFRHWMPKKDAEREFNTEFPIGSKSAPFGQHKIPKDEAAKEERSVEVWELWHKPSRKVMFISEEDTSKYLRETDDPLRLTDFWPIPRPLYSIPQLDTLIPVPEYLIYKDLAEELQTLTDRLNKIERSIRVRGLYDAQIKSAKELFEAPDTEMIAAVEAAALRTSGGIASGIWMHDNAPAAKVLEVLAQYRDRLLQAIYDINGISDVLRAGATNPNETLGAQNLKARYGSLRIEPRQRAVSALLRDVMRLWSEIICEKFTKETLMQMTGMELPDNPDMSADMLWDEVVATMRNEVQLSYRIDVETDSTVADLTTADQNSMSELLQGISGFTSAIGSLIQTLAPLAMGGAIPGEAVQALPNIVQSLLLSVVRRAKLGRQVEDAIDQMAGEQMAGAMAQQPMLPPGQDPAMMNAGGAAGMPIGATPPGLPPGQGMSQPQLPAPMNGEPMPQPSLAAPDNAGPYPGSGMGVTGQSQASSVSPPNDAMVAAYADVMRVAAQLSELGQQVAQSVTIVGEMVQGVSESPVMTQIAALAQAQAEMGRALVSSIDTAVRQSAEVSGQAIQSVDAMTSAITAMGLAPSHAVYDEFGRVTSLSKMPDTMMQ